MDKKDNKKVNIQVDISEEIAQGLYTNVVLSNFSKDEFVLDFSFFQPNLHKMKVSSRVIMSPSNIKRLVTMLNQNIANYESKFGMIDDEGKGFRLSVN